MKTTTINATQAPINATVQFMDVTYGIAQGIHGDYRKNMRTGKTESIGVYPKAKLEKSGKAAMRLIKASMVAMFNYRWDEFEGLIWIDANADNFRISICMHDDMEEEKAQDIIDKAISSGYTNAEDGTMQIDIKEEAITIELYGDAEAILVARDDTATFEDWLKIIG